MNLRLTSFIASILIGFTILMSSCDDNNTVVAGTGLSGDAQIYKLAISYKPMTTIDTANYKLVEAAKFTIDQHAGKIYNSDSLPYLTGLDRAFKVDLTFKTTPARLFAQYYGKDDTIWTTADSLDFHNLKGFRIIPPTGESNEKFYSLEVRVHQIDPDTILWTRMADLSTTVIDQKTLFDGDDFFTFHLTTSGLRLNKYNPQTNAWGAVQTTDLPATAQLRSITLFNNSFHAIDGTGKAYVSTNGTAWTNVSNVNIHSILGTLPAAKEGENDLLLAVQKDGAKYKFVTTSDMSTFTLRTINGSADNSVDTRFLSSGFTSVIDPVSKSLLLTAGKTLAGVSENVTWSVNLNRRNEIEYTPTKTLTNNIFDTKPNRATFLYDKKLYAINDTIFAISNNQGGSWAKAPLKQSLAKDMPKTVGQSVIVDKENYIWVFGGKFTQKTEVWRGRLSRVIPKK